MACASRLAIGLLTVLACGGQSPSRVAAPLGAAPALGGVPTPTPTRAPTPAKQRLVLHAARAVVPRTGQRIAPAWLELEGETIARISTSPPDDRSAVRELGDATLLPGLVDAHTHLLHLEAVDGDGASMVAEAALLSDADRALRATTFARQMLVAGFTTVRDLGNAGRAGDVALKRAVARGWVLGPTMLVSTRALAPPGGQFPRAMAPAHHDLVDQEYAVVRSPDDARARAREAFFEGADVLKVIVDHGSGRTMTLDELKAVVETAHASGKKVAAHVLTAQAASLAVTAGVDSCEHGYEIGDATLAEMARKHIFLVPTDYPLPYYLALLPAGPDHEAAVQAVTKMRIGAIDRLKRAKRAGVRIVAGSDAYLVTPVGDRGKEAAQVFRAYAEGGLAPLEVLQAATSNAADLLGLPEKTMALEAGSPGDVIAVQGDPTKDAEALLHVVFVAKRGRVIDLE